MTNTMATSLAGTVLRIALSISYLSAVADRFGLWGDVGTGSVAWGNFDNFLAYTSVLNWYAPAPLIPLLGWTATVAEVVIAIGLLSGFWLTWLAYSSFALLLLFALTMTIATGPEAALSYSVWTAAMASFLLATLPRGLRGYEFSLKSEPSSSESL